MAHRGGKASTSLGRDSQPKYLGIKCSDGQTVKPGMIIVRQRGTHFIAGSNVKRGNDDTLYAMAEGRVAFRAKKKICFDGSARLAKIVTVVATKPTPAHSQKPVEKKRASVKKA